MSAHSHAVSRAPAPDPEEAKPNPRTARSQERLEQAKELIAKELSSGEWVSSAEIHRRLGDRIAEGTFGRAKAAPRDRAQAGPPGGEGAVRMAHPEAEVRAAYTEGRGKG
jgi:hypothetical protein